METVSNATPPEHCKEYVPALDRFQNQLSSVALDRDVNLFWECAPYFLELLSSDFFPRFINHKLERILQEPEYLPSAPDFFQIFVLQTPYYNLHIKIISPTMEPQKYVYSLTDHMMIGFLPPSSAVIELFHQPASIPNDHFDPARRLQKFGQLSIGPNDHIKFRSGQDLFRIIRNEGPLIALILRSSQVLRFCWEYDAETLQPVEIMAGDLMASRMQFAAEALGHLGNDESLAILRDLLEHEDHFLRWQAVQSAFGIDYSIAIELLQKCISDAHPHVRRAALKSLNSLPAKFKPEKTPWL
jgi:hypothetical protein